MDDDRQVEALEQLGVGDVPVFDPPALAVATSAGKLEEVWNQPSAGIPEGYVEIPPGGVFDADHAAYDTPGVQAYAGPDHAPGDPIRVPNHTRGRHGLMGEDAWAEAGRHIVTEPLVPHRPGVNIEIHSAFRSVEDQERINDQARNEDQAKYRAYLIRTDDGEDPEEVRKALGLERWQIRVMSRQEAQDELGFDWGREAEAGPREWSVRQLALFFGLAVAVIGQLLVVFASRADWPEAVIGMVCLWAISLALLQTWHRYDVGAQLMALGVDLRLIEHPEGD